MLLVVLFIFAYLCGSIPSGLWVGQAFFQKDIRQFGSGNLGTTNAFRVLGKKAGIVVLIMDLAKGMMPVALSLLFFPQVPAMLAGILAILGHTFPIFANFKGGKAVATSVGALLIAYPLVCLFAIAVFLVTLFLFSMVSLASITAAALTMILSLFVAVYTADILLFPICLVIGSFIIWRHRSNIERIKNGSENRVPFGLRAKK